MWITLEYDTSEQNSKRLQPRNHSNNTIHCSQQYCEKRFDTVQKEPEIRSYVKDERKVKGNINGRAKQKRNRQFDNKEDILK